MENRRDFVKKASVLAAGGLLAGNIQAASAASVQGKAKKVVGLQTYSVARELAADVPAGMKKLASIGYSNLELAGYSDGKIGDIAVAEYRKIAESAGLKITGAHVNPPGREKYSNSNKDALYEWWKKTIADHVTLGVRSLVQPSMPIMETHDDVKMVCEVFNKVGEMSKAAGFKWGYHNHSNEFRRIVKPDAQPPAEGAQRPRGPQGDVIYDLMLAGTDASLVFFEMDVYWTVMGQNDPIEYFNKYPNRFPILHIKDRLILGESGMMNFETIFKKAYANGLSEYFVELEGIRPDAGMTQFEGVAKCYDYLANAPFVK